MEVEELAIICAIPRKRNISIKYQRSMSMKPKISLLLFLTLTILAFSYSISRAQSCLWQGQEVPLQHIGNVTVEGFSDAQLVGKCKLNAPSYCINGEWVNVWKAPNEYPGQLIVHNGDQGPQCTYQTFIMQ